MSSPARPVLRWHGGKWLLAPWIIEMLPPHRVYVEPFGGAWSVGMRKPRAYAEVWNDLDDELVNLFTVLRDERLGPKLVEKVRLTPFARAEFDSFYEPARNRLERARRLVGRSFMGHGSDGASGMYRTGFRAACTRAGTTPAQDWANYPPALAEILDRLQGVVIEKRPALQVMERHDGPDTLHFVDPPYLAATRSRANRRADNGGVYRHELTDEQHVELLTALNQLSGMVALCGYPSDLYESLLPGWQRFDRAAMADGARPRTECVWLNQAAIKNRRQAPLPLW